MTATGPELEFRPIEECLENLDSMVKACSTSDEPSNPHTDTAASGKVSCTSTPIEKELPARLSAPQIEKTATQLKNPAQAITEKPASECAPCAPHYQEISTYIHIVQDVLEDVAKALEDKSKVQSFLDSAKMIYGQNADIYKHIFEDQLNLRRERIAQENAAQALESLELTNIYKDSSDNCAATVEPIQQVPQIIPRLAYARIKPSAQSKQPVLPLLPAAPSALVLATASSMKALTPGAIKKPAKNIPRADEKARAGKATSSKKANDTASTPAKTSNKPSKKTFNETVKSLKESMTKLLKKNETLEKKVELLTDEIKHLTKQQKKTRKESHKKTKSYTPSLDGKMSKTANPKHTVFKGVAPKTTSLSVQTPTHPIEMTHTLTDTFSKQKEMPTKLSEKDKMLQALAKIKSLTTPK